MDTGGCTRARAPSCGLRTAAREGAAFSLALGSGSRTRAPRHGKHLPKELWACLCGATVCFQNSLFCFCKELSQALLIFTVLFVCVILWWVSPPSLKISCKDTLNSLSVWSRGAAQHTGQEVNNSVCSWSVRRLRSQE